MQKVLVTGASGFIGTHLVPVLRAEGYEPITVNSSDGDVADPATWDRYPQADIVIHLAGRSFVPDSWKDPTSFIRCNLFGTMEALNYCKKWNARLVFLSSYLYGNPSSLPIAETAPIATPNPYAFSKKLAEEACDFYSKSFGVDIIVLRPFNVYGTGQPAHFLLPAIIHQVKSGGQIKVKDLKPRRDYVFVSDLVSAIVSSLTLQKGFKVYNIGSQESYSVKEVIDMIQQIAGTNLEILNDGERRKDEIMDTIADISLARKELNWSPQWTMLRGLTQMIADTNDHTTS